MFSVHFPWTNYGNGKVSDQWRRSAAGGWFPAMETMSGLPSSHFGLPFLVRLQNLEARQPQRNRRNLMSWNCTRKTSETPYQHWLSLGFPYQKGLWSPKFWTYHVHNVLRWAESLLFQAGDLVKCGQHHVSWILAPQENQAQHIVYGIYIYI